MLLPELALVLAYFSPHIYKHFANTTKPTTLFQSSVPTASPVHEAYIAGRLADLRSNLDEFEVATARCYKDLGVIKSDG